MSRIYDFTVVSVIFIISVVMHFIGAELLMPGTVLYEIAVTGTESMNGQQWADQVGMVITVWMPLMATGGIIAWALFREYRRQAVTAVQQVR